MIAHSRRVGWVRTAAMSWRVLGQRFMFVLFLILSLALLVMGRSHVAVMEMARTKIVDGMAPALDILARPMAVVENTTRRVNDFLLLQSENARLRVANAQLTQWQNAAMALENENKELRTLLNYKVEPALSYISARVIANSGGPFVRSLIVTAGALDGVREGMAAMTGDGLIGRIVEVGNWSSRILLITDPNSRIPVTVTGSGDHAILAGDNTAKPRLLYLPAGASPTTGSRVITSGHGGVFPPNLPVGVVVGGARGAVEPLAELGRINQVRLVDFNLKGGVLNPMAARLETSAKGP